MNRGASFFLTILLLAVGPIFSADSLQKARFTEVIRDVRVTKANTTDMREAKVNDTFEVPEVIRTGMDSRAELEAPDKTIARIGSNTIFSFEAAKRTMNLQSGSVLFHSPKGMGGGTIKTAAATAAVTGTTIMVGATSNGGFKLMVLEGNSRVVLPSGSNKVLNQGQMTFIMPGRDTLGPVINFDLQRNSQGSDLVSGFDNKVASQSKIDKAISDQQLEIKQGRAKSTETEVLDAVNNQEVLVLDVPYNPQTDGDKGLGPINSFPLLSAFLDSQIGNDLTLNAANLSSINAFLSSVPVIGTYKDFKIDAKANYGVIAGKNVNFSALSYDFSKFGALADFGIIANGTMTFASGNTTFSNTGNALYFLNTGGQINFGANTSELKFSATSVSFEALGDIYNSLTGGTHKFGGTSGDLSRLSITSKTGKIDLNYPVFNSAVTELKADTVYLNNFALSSYTGAKVLNVYTRTGNWYFNGSGAIPNNPGALNIFDGTFSRTDQNGGPGSQVHDGVTTYNINSYQNK